MAATVVFLAVSSFILLPAFGAQMDPFPATVETQTLQPASSAATIPAFPEQTDASSCPLDLPEELFHSVKSACGGSVEQDPYSRELHRSRCCPVLAAWLYSAYSRTALRAGAGDGRPPQAASYDMPVLPDDSETCVETLEKALGDRDILLRRPNETCDVVYCYCGIRLHPFSCPEAFRVSSPGGELQGGAAVKKMESACSSAAAGGLAGCSQCLNSLYSLNEKKKGTNRTAKMHSRDCELMGLTWLLNKNRTDYIRSVTGVLRAIMIGGGGGDDSYNPTACTLNSDGIPQAVDSSEIDGRSSSTSAVVGYYYLRRLLPLLGVALLLLL
ncbi:hypothetical protein M569_04371 [Genlisea aurea]|uniref:SPARK domain-containing protein n=1 Tax=Genlisea aurea TaxID=192259 RepID=S8CT09_9LAMI|nr:hypothetical protein M569_04371 [Genlisea aurea]